MTIPSSVPINVYEGNSFVRRFDFDFLIENASELVVKYVSAIGEETTLQLGIDYSINEIGNASGSYIIFPLNTSQFQILKPNEHISLSLNLPIKQENEFRNSQYFNFDVLEWTFDYIVRILQMLNQKLERCFKVPESAEIEPDNLVEELISVKNQSTTAAANAVSSAQTAQAAAAVASEKETSIIEKSQEFDETFEQCMETISELPEITNKANINLSNLTETGEKHFLNKNQITNCITELPNRIKYTLQDNVSQLDDDELTILAGSIIILPYGAYDISSFFNVGDTFINDNFEVYDTQFSDGKFFVWLKLRNNITHVRQGSFTGETVEFINISSSVATDYTLANTKSGTGGDEGTSFYYNTSTNYCKKYSSGSVADGNLYSFPFMITKKSGGFTVGVKQIFDGIGYIGSTIFVDKGIKGIVPNGVKSDGSQNNISFENNSIRIAETSNNKSLMIALRTSDDSNYSTSPVALIEVDDISENEYLPAGSASYISELNIWRGKTGTDYYNIFWLPCGYVANVSGVITNFMKKESFVIADRQKVDGKWVSYSADVAANTTLPASSGNTLEYSLASYLPDDGYNYEVLFTGQVNTGSSSSNQGALILHTDIISGQVWVCRAITHTNAVAYAMGTAILPVGTKRKVYVEKSSSTTSASFSLSIRGYRRIGNNI